MNKKTYLIFADNSAEFDRSLRYATLAARLHDAGILILYVLPDTDFQLWAGVEERMAQEQRDEAVALLKSIQRDIADIADVKTDYRIESGSKTDAVLRVLADCSDIKKLIVTTNVTGTGKGVILSYFTGAGSDKLPITLTIVPGHVPMDAIDKLVE